MATYTPATLIASKAMGNGSANIATWQYQNTGGGGTFGIARTMIFQGQAGATGQVNVEIGQTGATATAAQRIIDSYVLTAGVPYIVNGWFTVANNFFLDGFANSTTVNAAAYGLTSA